MRRGQLWESWWELRTLRKQRFVWRKGLNREAVAGSKFLKGLMVTKVDVCIISVELGWVLGCD